MGRVQRKLEQYKNDKDKMEPEAGGHEAARETARKRDSYSDFAELLLRIIIVLASVAMLAKSRRASPFTIDGNALAIPIGFMCGHRASALVGPTGDAAVLYSPADSSTIFR